MVLTKGDIIAQEVHGNVAHSGGISKLKEIQSKI